MLSWNYIEPFVSQDVAAEWETVSTSRLEYDASCCTLRVKPYVKKWWIMGIFTKLPMLNSPLWHIFRPSDGILQYKTRQLRADL